MTQTRRTPPSSQSPTLASVSPGRLSGERTSTTRSGPSAGKPRVWGSGSRSRLMNATSGARTVSGSVVSLNPVSPPGRLADYEDPTDELHTLVGNAGPEQLVGRHERGWHTRNVDAFGGHGNGIWRPSLNRVSTDLFAIFGYGARESGSFQQDSPNYRCAVSPYEDLDAFKACHQLTLAVHRVVEMLEERDAALAA